MKSSTTWFALLLSAGLILATDRASASSVYPTEVEEALMLSAPPACTLCHNSDVGGDGTVVTPFGRSMIQLGATGDNNRATLREALLESDDQGVDSDVDGVTDLDEIRAGEDPNDNPDPGAFEDLPLPEHGCAVSVTRVNTDPAAITLFFLLVGLACTRRRSRSAPRIG
jgi:hypothetical protein